MPLSEIKPELPQRRSLYEALNGEKAGFILECAEGLVKGLIRANFDAPEPGELRTLRSCYFFAQSRIFPGSLELPDSRSPASDSASTKDFFIDEEQVYRALFGADAILLMLSVLRWTVHHTSRYR